MPDDVSNGTIPEHWCWSCCDMGVIELYHPSTDALVGCRKCDCPRLPVWKAAADSNWKGSYERWRRLWKRTPAEIAAEAAMPF